MDGLDIDMAAQNSRDELSVILIVQLVIIGLDREMILQIGTTTAQ